MGITRASNRLPHYLGYCAISVHVKRTPWLKFPELSTTEFLIALVALGRYWDVKPCKNQKSSHTLGCFYLKMGKGYKGAFRCIFVFI